MYEIYSFQIVFFVVFYKLHKANSREKSIVQTLKTLCQQISEHDTLNDSCRISKNIPKDLSVKNFTKLKKKGVLPVIHHFELVVIRLLWIIYN